MADTLLTNVVMNPSNYLQNAGRVVASTGRMVTSLASLGAQIAGVGTLVSGGILGAASKSAADLESLTMGLTAVTGSAAATATQLNELREVAKIPGVGYFEAIQMSTALQAAGLSANDAELAIRGFGNALATVGKGKAELQLVQLALSQIASAPKIFGQDIKQLLTQLPQLLQITKKLYGTADTQAIEKMGIAPKQFVQDVTRELLKLPQVTGGAKNAFENLGDSMKVALAAGGQVINDVLGPALTKVGNFISNLAGSGEIKGIAESFKNLFGGNLGDALVNALAWVLATVKELPNVAKASFGAVVSTIDWVKNHLLGLSVVLGAVFLGGTIVAGVEAMIAAFVALRASIMAAGISAVIMEAIATGGASLAAAAVGLAAGAAAGAAIYASLNALFDKVAGTDPISGALGGTLDNIKKSHDDLMKLVGGGSPAPDASGSTTPDGGTASALGKITEYTKQTAKNTSVLDQLQQRILGGGATGAAHFKSWEAGTSGHRGGGNVEKAVRGLVAAISEDNMSKMLTARRQGQI